MPKDGTASRFLSFEIDFGGFNNILMQFEIIIILAWLTKRTLVLPASQPFYLLGSESFSLLDFFDLQALRHHIDIVETSELPALNAYSPGWDALRDVLLYPASAITDRHELIHRLHKRRPVAITNLIEDCELLHFTTSKDSRMFGVFEAFFLFADPSMERRVRRIIRDSIKYRKEICDLLQSAQLSPHLAGRNFSAMHIRRGDFQYTKTRVSPHQILSHTSNLFPEEHVVYLATDETDDAFLKPFHDRFEIIQFNDIFPKESVPYHWIGILETLICAAAPDRFVGTRLSTFSARIATLRGHTSCAMGNDSALYYTQPPLWGATQKELLPYSKPIRKHVDEHGETTIPWWISMNREPVWGRAYHATWADVD